MLGWVGESRVCRKFWVYCSAEWIWIVKVFDDARGIVFFFYFFGFICRGKVK